MNVLLPLGFLGSRAALGTWLAQNKWCWISDVCVCTKWLWSGPALCSSMDCSPARLLCPWDSPDKNTGVGCPALLWGIFPPQGWNPHRLWFLHCRQVLYGWATGEAYPTRNKKLEVNIKYTDVKTFHKHLTRAEDKEISGKLFNRMTSCCWNRRQGKPRNANFEVGLTAD